MPPLRVRLGFHALRMRLSVVSILLMTTIGGWWFDHRTDDRSPVGFLVFIFSIPFLLVTSVSFVIDVIRGIEVEAPVVRGAQTYSNNQYVEGAGWFHARSRTFQPHVFNHHDPVRGYFHDGMWSSSPAEPVAEGKPDDATADAANVAILSHAVRGGFGTIGMNRSGGS